jgi:hypothetical protein
MPSATPRDLHATTDIRFVMVEIGKMTEAIGEMKKTIEKQGDKISRLDRLVLIVSTGLGVGLGVTYFWLGGKFHELIEAVARVAAK